MIWTWPARGADEPTRPAPVPRGGATPAAAASSDRYMAGLLDHRSRYGKYWFPEPLLGKESDLDREFRLDWFHAQGSGRITNEVNLEIEGGFGLWTFEAELPYVNERETSRNPDTGRLVHERSEGIGNLEFSARHPVYQYVSPNDVFDYTLVAALEVAVPTHTRVSKDTEIVPELFQLFRCGEHVSLQTSVGLSFLTGPDEGGRQTLEYGATLGYNVERDQVKLPKVLSFTPLLEVHGERGLNRGENGRNALLGSVGVRVNLDSIGRVQPRIGLGYVFPLDKGARDELDWGIISSLVFEY